MSFFQDMLPSAEKPTRTGLLVNFSKPPSLPSSEADRFLVRLALLLTSEKTDDRITSNRQDVADHVHLIAWLTMILTEEKGISTARIEYSPRLPSHTGQNLRQLLDTHLPASDIRIVPHPPRNNEVSPPVLLQVIGDATDGSASFPVLQFGAHHPEGSFAFAPENVLIHAGDSPFLGFLLSDTPESRHYRQAIQQLLRNDRKTRLLQTRTQKVQQESLEKTHIIQDLRVSLRMLSNSKAATLADIHPNNPAEKNTAPSVEAASIPVPPLWLRACRRLKRSLRPRPSPIDIPAPNPATDEDVTLSSPTPFSVSRVLFIAGEPGTPGVLYRCDRNAAAARDAGFEARVVPCASVGFDDIRWADVMVFWRVEYSGHVSTIFDLARSENVMTIFDADDIVFVPHYARVDLIDGIRSIGATEEQIERCFSDMRRTFLRCDQGSTTTAELVFAMHSLRPVVHLLPNVYDMTSLKRARMALRMRGEPGSVNAEDGLVRIGYAAGSRTHQRDFGPICTTIADILHERPQVRLVLFREPDTHRPILLMDEFPSLIPVQDQIEWRDMVPLAELQDEFARFDISIAPLETGNVFCEAKSEIKFFEAALSGVVTVASPTGPFQRVIHHGETGLLASSPAEWHDALIALIDNPERRIRMARDAYHSILWPFGPQAQARRMKLALTSLNGDDAAALAVETSLARDRLAPSGLPVIPASRTLFHHDALGEAPVTVVITSYNYEAHLLDALESVAAQTLPVLDLIVVDDGSSDGSLALTTTWMERHRERFNRLILRQSLTNAGLGGARNIGMDAAETVHVMQLDADNILRPEACEVLLNSMNDGTAYAYPLIACFNENGPVLMDMTADTHHQPSTPKLLGDLPFNPLSLVSGNRIDAMAMVTKWAWAAVGGYYVSREAMGWEDFDLWCSMTERGLPGHHVPQILADYRQHETSMTNASTEKDAHKARVVAFVQDRHPWIRLSAEQAKPRKN
ncbi:glycosyltransferase [Gluconobacter albidus]|uniref:glycosyltransferase n=1 Tax=Gluconobacter albidus TaxID=318683 RepID=UPI00209C8EE0|nr:glycosyltransferase [Gluconobacter albidus]MCP1273890.1 glycosyltransferase [Gluconobacter albidus]